MQAIASWSEHCTPFTYPPTWKNAIKEAECGRCWLYLVNVLLTSSRKNSMNDTVHAIKGGRTDSEFKFGCVGLWPGANDLPSQRLSMYNNIFLYNGHLLTPDSRYVEPHDVDRISSGWTVVFALSPNRKIAATLQIFGAKLQHNVRATTSLGSNRLPEYIVHCPLRSPLVLPHQYRLWFSVSIC